jgi:Transposase DDE domain
MNNEIVAIYCLCDDILKAMNHRSDVQQQMSDAEVMTTAIVAAMYFCGNFEKARKHLSAPHYIPTMLSKSRLNRRLHLVEPMLLTVFEALGQVWKQLNPEAVYSIDSFPISVCDNIRISRSKLYDGEEAYRGYQASKKRYFYGIKIHLMVTATGAPVEFFLTPGSFADVKGLKVFPFALPEGSVVYADKAYTDYAVEDLLLEAEQITLSAMRKSNSRRPVPAYVQFVQHYKRKVIETSGSLISQFLPKSIHAVTAKGFELKTMLFVLALSVNLWVAT